MKPDLRNIFLIIGIFILGAVLGGAIAGYGIICPRSIMTKEKIIFEIFKLAAPLAAAALAYFHYLKQREHELVRHRYLEEGLDALTASLQHALTIFQHNWSTALMLLKQFREYDHVQMRDVDLNAFLPLDLTKMDMTSVSRVSMLIGDQIVWQTVQSVFAFVVGANFDFKDDLARMIELVKDGQKNLAIPKEQAAEKYKTALDALQTDAGRYYKILGLLHSLVTIFERERFTLKTVANFRNQADVQEIVRKLQMVQSTETRKTEPSAAEVRSPAPDGRP